MGSAQLHSIDAPIHGWQAPLEIASADLTLLPDEITVKNLSASAAGAAWHGTVVIPRPCGVTGTCPVHFDLHADEIALNRVNELLNPSLAKHPWYRFLSTESSGTPYLLTASAAGRLSAKRVAIHTLTATGFSANAELKKGHLELSEMRAEVLGGKHIGQWSADFTGPTPQYSGSGTLVKVSLRELAAIMHDGWITGTAKATYRAGLSGLGPTDLYSSASGTLQVEAWDAALPHVVLTDSSSALQIHHLTSSLLLQSGKFEIKDCRLQTPTANYDLSGTASFARVLDLKLTREGSPGFAITGTLAEPRVAELTRSETQAALKP